MTPEDSFKLATNVAEDRTKPDRNLGKPAETTAIDPSVNLPPAPFLHHRELEDAVRTINLIASGRNPFSNEPFEKLRPEHRDTVLQALCVLGAALASQLDQAATARHSESAAPAQNSSTPSPFDPATFRPLEDALQRLERDAILAALSEANHNKTAAARLLGITFRSLRYRMESLGLSDDHDAEL